MLIAEPKGKRSLEILRAYGRIILKLILRKQNVGVWTGFISVSIGTGSGLL
jgi:hypothetical protein